MTGTLIKNSNQHNKIMLFMICIYALHMANLLCLLNILPYFLWLILRIVVHGEPFLRKIEPLSARPFNFPKEFHLTEMEVNQNQHLVFLFSKFSCHFNFRLSVIGSRSERPLPHWSGTENSEVRVLRRKQQSFVSSAYSVYPEHLIATADDHMNTNETEVDYSSHLDEVETLLRCYTAVTYFSSYRSTTASTECAG